MLEVLKNIGEALIIALICGLGAWLLQARKQQILAIAQELIQKAEQAIQGTGLGAEKKAMVVAQLEAMGIKVNKWLDGEIDTIVAWLNSKGAWYVDQAEDIAKAAAEDVIDDTAVVSDKT